MIVDIGGGSTEAAVISLGGVVVHNSVRVGGNRIDEAITTYLKRSHNLIIGERSAEEIKINIGSAIAVQERNNTEVRGRDSITGLPRVMEISSQEVAEAIALPLNQIVEAIKGVLEQTPPELASDIIEKGIVMSGGTSLLRNLDKLFTQITGVPCHVAENPLFCVVNGTGLALENIDIYKRSLNRR